jgi:hypothetical protein
MKPSSFQDRYPGTRESKECKVGHKLQDQTLQAAQAAARQLLVRAIDLRFDLDDTADAVRTSDPITWGELKRLRADTEAVREAVERLSGLVAARPMADEDDDEVTEGIAATARG